MAYQKWDLGALSRDKFQGLGRILQEAFNPDGGGGIDCDLKVFGDEGTTSFFFYDHSEDKCFIQRTTSETSPGRLLYIQHLTSAVAVGQTAQGIQIRVRATGTGAIAGGTDGIECKVGLNSNSDTGTLAQARCIIANVDAKKGTITLGRMFECTADVGAGGTITTLAGFRVSLNNSGTVTTSYAFILDGTSVWTYGMYLTNSKMTTGIYVGTCTTGITLNSATTGIIVTTSTTGMTMVSTTRLMTLTHTLSGSSALSGINFTTNDTATQSSGTNCGINMTYNQNGVKTTSGAVCPILVNHFINANCPNVYGIYHYLEVDGDKTIGLLQGLALYWADVGANVTNLTMIDLGLNTTHATASRNVFIRCRQHSTVQAGSSVLRVEGNNAAEYLIDCESNPDTGQELLKTADYDGNTADYCLKVRLSVGDRWIQLYQGS